MRKKDFSDLEDQIKDTLKNTFNAIDFAKLKEDIDDKTENTLNEVKTNLKNKSQYLNEKMKNKRYYKHRNIANMISKDKNKSQMYIAKRPVGSVSGILYMTFGFTFGGLLGALLIVYSIFTSFFSVFSTVSFITFALIFSFLC